MGVLLVQSAKFKVQSLNQPHLVGAGRDLPDHVQSAKFKVEINQNL